MRAASRFSHIAMSNTRYGLGGLLALALMAEGGAASANGRFPNAGDIAFNRVDPAHLLLRTTYGFLQTRDSGENWSWTCEGALGIPFGEYDPPVGLTGDGTAVIAVSFDGFATSRDGCTWAPTAAVVDGQLIRDMTNLPDTTDGLLVMTSTHNPNYDRRAPYDNWIVETRDNARTWAMKGPPLPRNILVSTLEVAPSLPNRIYVSGTTYELPDGDAGMPFPRGVFMRSDDGGATWTTTHQSLPTDRANVFIAGVDPNNPDIVYTRVTHDENTRELTAPTILRVTYDKGVTWRDLVTTALPEFGVDKSMLGFALSPDGQKVVFGGLFGVYEAQAPVGPSSPFEYAEINTVQSRCLKWTSTGIYTCASEPYDAYTVGRSTDGGHTFKGLYRNVDDTCPLQCEAGTSTANVCPREWSDPSHPNPRVPVKSRLGASECCCGANSSSPECRLDAAGSGGGGACGTAGAGGTSGSAGTPSCSSPPAAESGCSTGQARFAAPGVLLAGLSALFLSWRRRRGRRADGKRSVN